MARQWTGEEKEQFEAIYKAEDSWSDIQERVKREVGRDVSKRALRRVRDQLDLPPIGEAGADSKEQEVKNKHKHLVSLLPAPRSEIQSKVGLSDNQFKETISELRKMDFEIKYDKQAQQYYLKDQPDKRRLSTKAKGTKTREANQFRTEQEAAVLRRLRAKRPLRYKKDPEPKAEDMVVAMGDTHIGDVVENEAGREVYDPKIAAASVQHLTDQALKIKRWESNIVDWDACHLFWLGDIVTNENIYRGQAYDIELLLADQLSLAVEVLTEQAVSLAEAFDRLTITAIPGNHGEVRSGYSSGQANMDLVAYRWVTDRLIERGFDNIDFRVGEAKKYRNVNVRGHTFHARHGEDESLHVDATARSQADQRGLVDRHGFDLAMRGHWHTFREETILNQYPVITVPSPKPGGDFAERIGRPDCSTRRRLGVLFRTSDERVQTGQYVIDDRDLDVGAADVPDIEDIRQRAI